MLSSRRAVETRSSRRSTAASSDSSSRRISSVINSEVSRTNRWRGRSPDIRCDWTVSYIGLTPVSTNRAGAGPMFLAVSGEHRCMDRDAYLERLGATTDESADLFEHFEQRSFDGRTYHVLSDARHGLERGTV